MSKVVLVNVAFSCNQRCPAIGAHQRATSTLDLLNAHQCQVLTILMIIGIEPVLKKDLV